MTASARGWSNAQVAGHLVLSETTVKTHVTRILTNSPTHPHGIKVMLDNGKIGRVQVIV